MASNPENMVSYEYHRMQLMGSLNNLAEQMRNCSAIADQFARVLGTLPYGTPAGHAQVAGAASAPTGRKRKLPNVEDGDGKRKRKLKDPNAPKRPASSYLIFQNDVRQELKQKHPEKTNNELLTMIAKLWSEMPREQKEAYEVRQKAAKDQWLSDKAAYDGRISPDIAAGAATLSPAIAVIKPASKTAPKPAAPVAVPSESSDESSSPGSSSEASDAEEEEEEQVSPPKKLKKEAPAAKEKKPKSAKA